MGAIALADTQIPRYPDTQDALRGGWPSRAARKSIPKRGESLQMPSSVRAAPHRRIKFTATSWGSLAPIWTPTDLLHLLSVISWRLYCQLLTLPWMPRWDPFGSPMRPSTGSRLTKEDSPQFLSK